MIVSAVFLGTGREVPEVFFAQNSRQQCLEGYLEPRSEPKPAIVSWCEY